MYAGLLAFRVPQVFVFKKLLYEIMYEIVCMLFSAEKD